ncbi:sensor histidine kinase [Methylotuvimicrobium buryatense]|uniref:histidine kinase n=1 Tax=Methylotuvimicrobium buryatense TaxID=95641 RepID=A0A4V1IJS2_METBY|nr:sensor histidine kinase [Methylotuvimicrobium buryatense]QCW82395.1 sensor histidine kinase [Methylotuvimicrobium buryatense]
MEQNRTLRTEILIRLITPVLLFVVFEAVSSYYVTRHYVDEAYDRWLLDSAGSLVQEIKVNDNRIIAELPPAALTIFKWDELDKTYFKIIAENQGMIAGDSFVPEPFDESTDWSTPVFFNDTVRGESVRGVSILVAREDLPEIVFVHVAETLNKRRNMMMDILLADLIPPIVLAIFIGFYMRKAVYRGLSPLRGLADEIAMRSPKDLSPIPEAHVFAEVRILTDTINGLLKRLDGAIASQQRFIANAAHQLRTPLAGLKLQSERALREDNMAAMKPALLQIQSSADRVSHIISQLLALAKSGAIESGLLLEKFDLLALVREVSSEWVPKALQNNIELSFEGPKHAVYINGNEILIRELLVNLLDNAICYGRENGSIIVRLKPGSSPTLTVEDDGPGIPVSEMDKIFERFYRIPGSPGDGCGLGLPIVKEIADLHQAELVLGTSPGKGGTKADVVFKQTSTEK